jgi:hypothetical protein
MNERALADSYAIVCDTLRAIRKSGEWKDWCESWEEYVAKRWSITKSRAKLLCDFAKFREMALREMFGTLPETPEQVKPILALPHRLWLEVWQLCIDYADGVITAKHCEGVMMHFGINARRRLSPEALKAIRVRRAAKTMADMRNGEQLVSEIGAQSLGSNWERAVEVVIDADQARMNERRGS